MSAKEMNPRKSTSSFSKREKMRRNPLQPAEQPLNLVPPLVHLPVIGPRLHTGAQRWNHRHKPQGQGQLAGSHCPRRLGPSTGMVLRALRSQTGQQLAPFRRIMGLPWGERERYGSSSIRGNPYEPWWSNPLGTFRWTGVRFLRAPVPSGWTLTMVLSRATASSLTRTICSRCRCSNTRSSTPFLDQRFILV